MLAMPPGAGPDWVETEVIEVCRPDRPEEPHLRPHVVVLRERAGTRRLPMFTGSAEAVALACSLDAGESPKPRAYQLAADLLTAAGSQLAEVRITTLDEGIFYAAAVVAGPDGAIEVAARSSCSRPGRREAPSNAFFNAPAWMRPRYSSPTPWHLRRTVGISRGRRPSAACRGSAADTSH